MRDLTYFLSDLHLGAGYIPDHRAHERRVVDFLRSIEPRAKRIYLLGDILDYWWEYRDVVPRGFVRFFGELARLADSGVEITWFKGNHDIWIFDYLPSEIGLEVHDGIMVRDIDGARFLLEHGDGVGHSDVCEVCSDAVWRNVSSLPFILAGQLGLLMRGRHTVERPEGTFHVKVWRRAWWSMLKSTIGRL